MRSMVSFATLSFLYIGCATSIDPQDDIAAAYGGDTEFTGATDSAAGAADTYFEIESDLRRCASPACGGWFLERLNRWATRCHDGQNATSCYTPVLDWSEAGLTDEQRATMLGACGRGAVLDGVHAIVRGRFAPTNSTTPAPRMGRFVITEAWVAENEAVSDGTFVRVADNGIRCVTSPCPSVTEMTLNTSASIDIAAVDFAPAALTEDEVATCVDRMATPEGIMVAGDRYTVEGDAGSAPARSATAAYYRLGYHAP